MAGCSETRSEHANHFSDNPLKPSCVYLMLSKVAIHCTVIHLQVYKFTFSVTDNSNTTPV